VTGETIRVAPAWLRLREDVDAAARSRELVELLRRRPFPTPLVIHDLACGSGAMGRWLAPLLPAPQRWILHDRDPDLLALAAVDTPVGVEVETQLSDVTLLDADDLAGAALITASALLDLLTGDELTALVRACAGAACPVLLTLSVTGQVELAPADPLDGRVEAAFNEHQRRPTARGPLLGPDAVDAAVRGFRRLGRRVVVRQSPWRLGPGEAALAAEWFDGWAGAACEQEPQLAAATVSYRRRRAGEAASGRLAVTVGHADLLVLP
jgi:hypothetical protein